MEIWKQTNYENYQVSNLGNVRNTKTKRVLKNSLSKSNGYYKVSLSRKGERSKVIEVHRLVAETFIPRNESLKLVVDHIDGNRLNNKVSNLQWITSKANNAKANRVNKNPRFTKQQKNEIKKLYSTGISLIQLTIYFNELWDRTSSRQCYTRIARK